MTGQMRTKLTQWVRMGGHLILLDAGDGQINALKSLLEPMQIKVLAPRPLLPPPPVSTEALEKTLEASSKPVSPLARIRLSVLSPNLNLPDDGRRELWDTHGVSLGKSALGCVFQPTESGSANETSARTLSDEVVVLHQTVGLGDVVVTGSVDLFSDKNLGANSDIPNDRQMLLLRMLFAWFRSDKAMSSPTK